MSPVKRSILVLCLLAALLADRARARAAELAAPTAPAATAPLRPLSAPGSALDATTVQALERALSCVNLSIADLDWDKRPIDDAFRLSCVNESLDHPLSLADRALRAEREFTDDPAASARAAAAWLDVTLPSSATSPSVSGKRFPGAPAGAARLLALLVDGYERASRLRAEAMGALSADEARRLTESGARLYTDESEDDWDMIPVLNAAKKADIAKLVEAELVLAETARAARAASASLDSSAWTSRTWRFGTLTVGLGGKARDVHSERVVLDAGGDDLYTGGSVVLDLAGNDTYRDAGPGFMDVALVVDLAGDDRYLGKSFSQGGAALGASLLIDVLGDDRYESDQCSQGAAFFGIGMLFDLAGSDAYRGARFVQGFGGTRGIGVLSDVTGNDTYYAGGKYLHAPLLPENYQSLSQGFGFGLRGASASGGVGILADHAGNDVYSAEVFGQGASYWFSLGILADSAGHDKYNLYQYGQGAGIHLSAGVLFDRAGNDAYSCNNGVAQGSGHDWGVGLLWDLAGDDGYQGSGMSQGGANANGIGMLIDRAGNDSYAGWNVKNQGDSFLARGTIGHGVLLDLTGKDRYTHGGSDGGSGPKGTVAWASMSPATSRRRGRL
jgi:hypothetical protein